MKQTKILMGMPITIEIVDREASKKDFDNVFKYFQRVDKKFSTYKDLSEISRINRGELKQSEYSGEMKTVFELSEQTKKETKGFFDVKKPDGLIDPSGLVKGWAIFNAAKILELAGFKNFYIEAGGDIQALGNNCQGKTWSVGIRNPFKPQEIIKIFYITNQGVATSGSYMRGQHIYNPHQRGQNIDEIVSLTVVGPNIYEADRFATAAFAMGREGIMFIENLKGFEAYMVDKGAIATSTTGFEQYYAQLG